MHRAFVDYVDSDTIEIHTGFGECNGHYWEITSPIEHDMTGLTTTEDFHYIYIDDANSIYPEPRIIDRTTEPTWSDSKMGWYNGDDRCIGAVLSNDGSASLVPFGGNYENKILLRGTDNVYLLQNGNPTGKWELLDCSSEIPVNATAILIGFYNSITSGSVSIRVAVYGTNRHQELIAQGTNSASLQNWLDLPEDCEGDLEWNGLDYANNDFYIRLRGWTVSR
jgi:hypothetical protein